MQEPVNQLDGTRDCAFLDPSANLIRFSQRRPKSHVPASRSAANRW
jgi:hypothetical protein